MKFRNHRNRVMVLCLVGPLAGMIGCRHQNRERDTIEVAKNVGKLANEQVQLEKELPPGLKGNDFAFLRNALQTETARNMQLFQTTNSPIKIRGGAMTFRNPNAPWNSGTCSGKTCYNTTTYSSGIDFIGDGRFLSATGSKPTLSGLTQCWTMTLQGRNTHGKDSQNGIEVSSNNRTCGASNSLTLELYGNGTFYLLSPDLEAPGDGLKMKRFMDNSCHGLDEDTCERMSTISLVLNAPDNLPDTTLTTTYTNKCRYGECEIDIAQ